MVVSMRLSWVVDGMDTRVHNCSSLSTEEPKEQERIHGLFGAFHLLKAASIHMLYFACRHVSYIHAWITESADALHLYTHKWNNLIFQLLPCTMHSTTSACYLAACVSFFLLWLKNWKTKAAHLLKHVPGALRTSQSVLWNLELRWIATKQQHPTNPLSHKHKAKMILFACSMRI